MVLPNFVRNMIRVKYKEEVPSVGDVPFVGIYELANPLLSVMLIVLMVLSGYTIGRIISKVRLNVTPLFFRDLIYGNVAVNFLFLCGFIIFGVLRFALP
jgi:hypothetical protein